MGMPAKKSANEQRVRAEYQSARNHLAHETRQGDARRPGRGRALGAATKDSRHGVHTDHTASRRSESRRDGSMGRESQAKSNRKNV